MPILLNLKNLEIVYRLRSQLNKKTVRIKDEVKEVIEEIDHDTSKIIADGKYSPASLSGGEAQRLALAKAILCRPKVIFVDEPTTFMDGQLINQTLTVLLNLVFHHCCSIIVVTHQYNELYKILNTFEKKVKINRYCLTKDKQDESTVSLKMEED